MSKKITFEEYLQENHAEDYRGTDDNMPDDFSENYLPNLEIETLKDYFELYIRSEYAYDKQVEQYTDFILSLTQ